MAKHGPSLHSLDWVTTGSSPGLLVSITDGCEGPTRLRASELCVPAGPPHALTHSSLRGIRVLLSRRPHKGNQSVNGPTLLLESPQPQLWLRNVTFCMLAWRGSSQSGVHWYPDRWILLPSPTFSREKTGTSPGLCGVLVHCLTAPVPRRQ